jgi:probable rRNA maturation factor
MRFTKLKNEILGEDYSLSLAFVDRKTSRRLNKIYRKKDEATNILSFPLSKKTGEILICPAVVKAEIKKFGRSYRQLLALLVIHGMLHLKGMRHGAKMDRLEEEYDQKYFSRH